MKTLPGDSLSRLLSEGATGQIACSIEVAYQNGKVCTSRGERTTRVPAAKPGGRIRFTEAAVRGILDGFLKSATMRQQFGHSRLEFVIIDGEIFDVIVTDSDVLKTK